MRTAFIALLLDAMGHGVEMQVVLLSCVDQRLLETRSDWGLGAGARRRQCGSTIAIARAGALLLCGRLHPLPGIPTAIQHWLLMVATVRRVAILGIKTQIHLSHEREALAAQVT
jgi:hypothetical protein